MTTHLPQTVRLLKALLDARLRGHPMVLSHLVTYRCPCRCETCLWRDLVASEMSAGQIAEFYQQASAAGILVNSIWGGEPLVRDDLSEILQSSHNAGLVTVLITSGLRFNQRVDELVRWLNVVIFSVDHPSTRHDEMRGMPGLFDAIQRAIRRLQALPQGPRVMVNAVVSRLNQDAIADLAEWARDMSVPICFNPIETDLPGLSPHRSVAPLGLDDDTRSRLFRRLIVMKTRGFPIHNSYTHLRTFINGKRPYRCHARKVYLQLRPNGDLVDCLDRSRPVANIREQTLAELLARPDIRRRRLANIDCHVCNNANVIDTSHIWELHPESILSLISSHLSRA
jgi:MoaA/NifB/PqqE/SkfB family radical SAM enzyme